MRTPEERLAAKLANDTKQRHSASGAPHRDATEEEITTPKTPDERLAAKLAEDAEKHRSASGAPRQDSMSIKDTMDGEMTPSTPSERLVAKLAKDAEQRSAPKGSGGEEEDSMSSEDTRDGVMTPSTPSERLVAKLAKDAELRSAKKGSGGQEDFQVDDRKSSSAQESNLGKEGTKAEENNSKGTALPGIASSVDGRPKKGKAGSMSRRELERLKRTENIARARGEVASGKMSPGFVEEETGIDAATAAKNAGRISMSELERLKCTEARAQTYKTTTKEVRVEEEERDSTDEFPTVVKNLERGHMPGAHAVVTYAGATVAGDSGQDFDAMPSNNNVDCALKTGEATETTVTAYTVGDDEWKNEARQAVLKDLLDEAVVVEGEMISASELGRTDSAKKSSSRKRRNRIILLVLALLLVVVIPLVAVASTRGLGADKAVPAANGCSASHCWVQLGPDLNGTDFGEDISMDGSGTRLALSGKDAPASGGGKNAGYLKVYDYIPDGGGREGYFVQVGQTFEGKAGDQIRGTLSRDGTRLAVAAPHRANRTGMVSIYERRLDGSNWTLVGKPILGIAEKERFGFSRALSNDGKIVAIGAPNAGSNRGHVRIFQHKKATNSWDQIGLNITGSGASDKSGWTVALSDNGRTVAIGSQQHDDGAGRKGAGHLRVFRYVSGNWTMVGDDIGGKVATDYFGKRVALSGDGTTVCGSAEYSDGNGMIDSGHVRVFSYGEGSDKWLQVGDDINGDKAFDRLIKVSLSRMGSRVAVSSGEPNNETGYARVYEIAEDTWRAVGGKIPGRVPLERFGGSVALSSDGNRLLVGVKGFKHDPNDIGFARLFELRAK